MMLAASAIDVSGSMTLADQHMAIYHTYMAQSDQSPEPERRVRQNATQAETGYRTSMDVPLTGPMPSGVSIRANMVGFKVIKATPTEVLAYVETRLSLKPGELKSEHVVYLVNALAVSWHDDDWKFSLVSAGHLKELGDIALPAVAAPGDAAFNTVGWTAIRQAS